jgi:signal transduction histidine kinase
MTLAPSYIAVRLFLDGMLCMMALFALLSHFQHRKPLYWQYALYIVCMILDLRLSDIGYAQPDYQPGAFYPETLLESLGYMLYIRFAILLIDPIRQDPFSYRLMRLLLLGFAGALLIDTLLWLADGSAIIRSSVYMTTRLLICALVLYLVPRLFRLRSPVLSYFIAGTLLLLIGSIAALLLNYLPIESQRISQNAFTFPITILQISIVGEVLFFAMGMSLRNRQNERQKILYQAQLIEQLRENERKQDKLQRIREDIAHDLHDDVGSDLSSIGVLSQVAARQVDENPEAARATIQRIGQTARRVVTTMREIIWSMNSAQTSLASFSQRLQEMATMLFEYQTAKLSIHLPDDDLTRLLPVESRRDLFLMVKEMLHNAIRHADAQHVYVTMWVADDALHLTVRDDGRGFPSQAYESQAGNGLLSMHKRTKALNGCLTIDSQSGMGTTLIFQCPLATEELVVG